MHVPLRFRIFSLVALSFLRQGHAVGKGSTGKKKKLAKNVVTDPFRDLIAQGAKFELGPKNMIKGLWQSVGKTFDKDNDGKLSQSELLQAGQAISDAGATFFSQADSNGNGFIDPEELPRMMELDMEKHMERFDTNKDSKLSLDEVLNGQPKKPSKEDRSVLEKRFKDADRDGNSYIDLSELPGLAPSGPDEL